MEVLAYSLGVPQATPSPTLTIWESEADRQWTNVWDLNKDESSPFPKPECRSFVKRIREPF